jgi:hypothetical protein
MLKPLFMTEVFYFQFMKRKLLISFLVLVLMVIVMRWQGAALVTPASPRGIVDLEFANRAERLMQLRLFWDQDVVVTNIFLDFLLIAAYAWFFFTACSSVSKQNPLSKWSRHFAGLSMAAAFFDVCENFLMLLVWNERFSPVVLKIVLYCAAIKFILIALVILFLIVSFLLGLARKKTPA